MSIPQQKQLSGEPKRAFSRKRPRWLPKFRLSFFNSIGSKLFLYVLSGALVGLGGMSYFFYQVLEEQAKNEIRGTLKNQVESIDGQLKRIEESMIGLSSAVTSLRGEGINDPDVYNRLACQFFQARPHLVVGNGFGQTPFQTVPSRQWYWPYFYVAPSTRCPVGRPDKLCQNREPLSLPAHKICSAELFLDDNYPEQDYYTVPVAAKKPVWSEPYDWFGITMTSFLNPFFDNSGQMIGVAGADVNVTALTEQIHESVVQNAGYFAILSEQGKLLAYPPDPNKAKTREDCQNIPLFSIICQNIQQYTGNMLQINGTFLGSQRIPSTHWLMLAVVPKSVVLKPVFTIIIAGTLGAGIVLALVVVLFVRRLNNRLQPILNECQRLADGTDTTQEELRQSGVDELAVLDRSFNQMAKQLKASFETLETKNAELRRLDQFKDEFLANTSHELRTPLNGIIGLAESLIDGATGELTNNTKANLTMIVSSGKRLSALVNDILDFSKLRHKNIELQFKPIGLREIVEVVLTLSQPLIAQKEVQLINAIEPELPLAHADENRLQQILHNLVGNAIKFTEQGTVKMSAKVVNQQLEITVSDTGIGVPEDKLEQIFESFEQAEGSTAREYGGTGLGLAITKQLVELHGGTIWIESKIGVGSQFIFTLSIAKGQVTSQLQLPIVSHQLLENTLSVETTAPVQPSLDKGQYNILIVDDEPVNLQVLFNHLSLQNYTISQATNGMEALDKIEAGSKPDLILLDVMMPKMTGYEVCKTLRQRFPATELPIVMLTAKNQVSDLVEGLNVGANDYLTKPISKDELLARVKMHIQLAQFTQKLFELNKAYERFVPQQFLSLLDKKSITDVQLGDHVAKEMTILFSDMRCFTTLSEQMTPQENFNFINTYLSQMAHAIHQHQGVIDKYIGDAIMALFPTNADDAVRGSITLLNQLVDYNKTRQQGLKPIAIGIGLNTGQLMLGTIGNHDRMDGTVISDAVNLASRIENMTKRYGAALLISESTYSRLADTSQYHIRTIDRVKVKGKTAPVIIYEVFDGDAPHIIELKMKTLVHLKKGLVHYRQKEFTEAIQCFKQMLRIHPEDKVAQIYLKRCEHFQQVGVPADWEGVSALESK